VTASDPTTSGEPLDAALESLESDIHLHVHGENGVRFLAVHARAGLTAEVGR